MRKSRDEFIKAVTGEARKKHDMLVRKAMKLYEEARRENERFELLPLQVSDVRTR